MRASGRSDEVCTTTARLGATHPRQNPPLSSTAAEQQDARLDTRLRQHLSTRAVVFFSAIVTESEYRPGTKDRKPVNVQ
jgi:hypothetical protein